MKYFDLGHAFTKIIRIMSILKSIWSDSLVVDIDHTYVDRVLEGTILFVIVKCMHSF